MVEYLGPNRDEVLYGEKDPPIYVEPRGYRLDNAITPKPTKAPAPVTSIAPVLLEPSNEPPNEHKIELVLPTRLEDAEFLTGLEEPVREILLGIVPEELARWDPTTHKVLMEAGSIIMTGNRNIDPALELDHLETRAILNLVDFVRSVNAKIQGTPTRRYETPDDYKPAILNYINDRKGRYPMVEMDAPDLDSPALAKSIVSFYQGRAAQALEFLS